MADINVGVLAEQMNSKADIDLRNIDTTKCDMVIEYQEPTAENNYTWYRLYATGWIEQGGKSSVSGDSEITLPINMSDTNYNITVGGGSSGGAWPYGYISSISTIHIGCRGTTNFTQPTYWQVSGKVYPSVMLNHEILPSKAKNEEFEHRVISFQKPTAGNNYTWYRKYADGWVEMGGSAGTITALDSNNNYITLPVAMLDTNYTATMTLYNTDNMNTFNTGDVCPDFICGKTTTQIQIHSDLWKGQMNWRVEGLYATE